MDKEQIDKLLRELIAVNRENNQILRGLNFDRRLSMFLWFIKWIVIAGIAYGAYQTAAPYVSTLNETVNKINSITNPAYNINKTLFDKVKEKITQ
jgi:hypothetical protein